MMLPAAVARLWAQTLPMMFAIAAVTALVSGYLGLVASFQFALASGPTIILTASCIYVLSLLLSPSGVARRLYSRPHLRA
jgi:zinc/manganese transport system permease protein